MKKLLITTGVAVLAFATVVGAQSTVFSTNLTVGSTGADVVALQTALISAGQSIPAIASGAAAKGYFGSQTKTAVQAYQTAKGIPSTGFVGPLTRAALNGTAGTTASCPAGFTCTSNTVAVNCPVGFTCTSNTTGAVVTGITTIGVEGTLSATQSNSGLASSIYEGDSMVSVLGVKLEAKTSDISVQRIKLDLGTTTTIYNKIYSKLYVADGSTILGSVDLNSSTVVKDGSRYYVSLTGLNSVIAKGTSKTLIIKADVRSTIDTGDLTGPYVIRLADSGVRGVDGAGIDQHAGDTTITKSYAVSANLVDSSTLKVSLNTSSPKKTDVVATAGSLENELDNLTLMSFDVKAEKDTVTITDLSINVTASGAGTATASTTLHLYDGSTELDSVSFTSNWATFSSLDLVVAKNSTKTLTVKVDVRGANTADTRFVATASSTGFTTENSIGDNNVTVGGSATGNSIGVRKVGPVFSLVGTPTITKSIIDGGSTAGTSTAKASYVVRVEAVGGDIVFGSNGSSSPMFPVTAFYTLKGGTATALNVASSTAFSIPSSGVVTSGTSFTLQEGNSVTIPVDFIFEGRNATNGANLATDSYSVGMSGITWNSTQSSTFMSGELDWSTPSVVLP